MLFFCLHFLQSRKFFQFLHKLKINCLSEHAYLNSKFFNHETSIHFIFILFGPLDNNIINAHNTFLSYMKKKTEIS